MSQPFLGEVKIISWNFSPKGWAFCNGQFLPINQNQALFSLLGTMYGGNGQTTFALPDLRGRAPLHMGAGFLEGQSGGQEFHTITQSEMPAHTHVLQASNNSNAAQLIANPTGGYLAAPNTQTYVSPNAGQLTTINPSSVTNTGGSQPHENRQPSLVLNMIIALVGIFPSRN